MHFILGVFIACITLVTAILFEEIFPKWVKILMVPIGALSSGYAISILIRKIAEETNAFSEPKLYSTALIASAIMLVIIIIVRIIINRKKA